MASNLVDLKLDKTKLNSSFDEYKLSLDSIPCYKLSLEFKPENVELSDKQFSLQHVKTFGNQNILYQDPWMSNCVYFIDERWKVLKFRVSQETNLEEPKPLLQIPDATERGLNHERINASLSFASYQWTFLANGSGKLYILDTFNREEDLMWKISHSCEPVEEATPFKVLHSTSRVDVGVQLLDCLLVHVENNESSEKSPFKTVLEWLTFGQVEGLDDAAFELKRVRKFEGKTSVDYCAILPGGLGVDIASERPFKMVFDSVNPVKSDVEDPKKEIKDEETDFEEIEEIKEEGKPALEPCYFWTQTEEDVSVFVTLPPNTCKPEVSVTIKPNHLKLALTSGDVILSGRPCGDIDVEESTWIVANEEVKSAVGEFVKPDQLRLQIILAKKDSGKWSEAITETDKTGMFVVDEKQIADMRGLDSMTSEKMNPDPEECLRPAYNVEELEDCDVYPDENSVLMRFDGESHQITHQVNLGNHQWLFNVYSGESRSPCLCLRHDVDGIVWQPQTDQTEPVVEEAPWLHQATFDAFGYVQASKQQRKFTTCAPDYSYAVICDSVRHMYLYRQPTPTNTELRNRKTGRQVNTVAKQQLVSLESVDTVTGIFADKERLFAVAGDTMYVLRVG